MKSVWKLDLADVSKIPVYMGMPEDVLKEVDKAFAEGYTIILGKKLDIEKGTLTITFGKKINKKAGDFSG